MANLKEIRTRISSVISTKQITSAMKMVAAARLRKAQNAIIQLRPYASKLHEILQTIAGEMDDTDENLYSQERHPNKILIVLVTSNRGLCGAFNANIIKKALDLAHVQYPEQLKEGNLHYMSIGKKGRDYLKIKQLSIVKYSEELGEKPQYDAAVEFTEELMDLFVSGEYDRIHLVYNQFKNAAVQIQVAEQLLPVEVTETESPMNHDFIFEPDRDKIITEIIPKSLRTQVYKSLIDSYAAEQGARMTAMHQATDNATELLRELHLTYNKARQADITKEILEIVGGANALEQQ